MEERATAFSRRPDVTVREAIYPLHLPLSRAGFGFEACMHGG